MCDKTFTNKTRLGQHNSAIHEGKKPIEYGICDYSCSLICFEVDMLTRLPHIGKQIFDSIDNLSLMRCKKISRSWNDFINEQNFLSIRIIKKNCERI